MDFNKVATKIMGYVNESIASGKDSLNVIYKSTTLGKNISLIAESNTKKARVEFRPDGKIADYFLKISLSESANPEAIVDAIVKGMKDHVVSEAWYDDDEELDAAEKSAEVGEFGKIEADVDPEDVDLYSDDFSEDDEPVLESDSDEDEDEDDEEDKFADMLKNKGRNAKVAGRPSKFNKDMLGEEAEESDDEDDEDEDEDKYADMLKNKGRNAKVANRPAKTPKPMLGEAAIKTDLSGNKSSLSKSGLKGCACKTPADPKVPTDGNATTKQVKDVEKTKSKNGKSPIKDKTPAAKVPKEGNVQDLKKSKTALSATSLKKSVPAKVGHDLLTSMANNLMYERWEDDGSEEEEREMRVLVDGAAGIYVPQRFVTGYDTASWGIKPEDAELLAAGPDAENYWEAWDDVLNYAKHTAEDGKAWRLEQDSDLFAVNADEVVAPEQEEEVEENSHYI